MTADGGRLSGPMRQRLSSVSHRNRPAILEEISLDDENTTNGNNNDNINDGKDNETGRESVHIGRKSEPGRRTRSDSWKRQMSLSTGRVSQVDHTGLHTSSAPPDVRIASRREIICWYIYDWSNGAFFFSALNFLPLLIVYQAGHASPAGCVRDDVVYPAGVNEDTDNLKHYPYELMLTNCKDSVSPFGFEVSYKSVPLYFTSLSVAMQLVAFLLFGGLADFGAARKKMLVAINTISALLLVSVVFVADESLYWLNGYLLALSNLGYGCCVIFYNAYLPLLSSAHHEVVAAAEEGASDEDLGELMDKKSHEMSLKGFATGFAGQFCVLFLNLVVFVLMSDSTYLALRLNISIAGIWSLIFAAVSFYGLNTRPGPPLPSEYTYMNFGIKRTVKTFKTYKRLPELFKFFGAYFIYSDGASTIGQASAIFATQELKMGNTGVLFALLEVSLVAALSCVIFLFVNKKLGVPPKTILLINLATFAVIPLYGFIWLKSTWEYYLLAFLFGLATGSLQSFTRSLFSEMIPEGREAEYFALFEVTDRGTAWLGPLVVAVVNDATGSFRAAFFAIIAFFVVGGFVLTFVDPEKAIREAAAFTKDDRNDKKDNDNDDNDNDNSNDSNSNNNNNNNNNDNGGGQSEAKEDGFAPYVPQKQEDEAGTGDIELLEK